MICLGMDTSSSSASVALHRDDTLVYECFVQNGLTHSATLMPMIEAALCSANLSLAQVDLLAVVAGPGSFTGVRIGIAAAMGLFAGRNCASVNGLEALAAQAQPFDGLICPLLDARAQQVYCAAFAGKERLFPDQAMALTDFLAALEKTGKPCLFVGDGALAHKVALCALPFGQVGAPAQMGIHAGVVARLGMAQTPTPAALLRPYYLRAPQAERERLAKEANHG